MRVTIKLNGKRISKKAAIEKYGKEVIERRIAESKEMFYEDPLTWLVYMDGMEFIFSY